MAAHLSDRRRQQLAALALSALLGLACAGLITLKSGDLGVAAAATHIFVDEPGVSIVNRRGTPQYLEGLAKHADLLGQVMVSAPVLERIGRHAGVDPAEIGAIAPTTADVPRALTEPDSEQRASEVRLARLPYRLEVQSRPGAPILDIYTEAPSRAGAERLADASVAGLRDYVQRSGPRLRQLGGSHGAVVNGGSSRALGVLTFLLVFGVTWTALEWLRRRRAGTASAPTLVDDDHGDDWPHTTRLLPWMLALFVAVLWVVPFDEIKLTASFPVELKFDRLILPFIAAVWLVALAVGGRVAPSLRFTWIHAALALFVALAFVSVLLNARGLSRTLELDLSFKRLPVLLAYASLFVIAASSLRATEVRSFLTYTLALAVLCALGVLWEYRFKQNWFYDWSDRSLPGVFDVAEAQSGAVDEQGRPFVRGPARVPVEAVAMLSMALPIALDGVLVQAKRRGRRLLYALAACILVAAMFATYRKSALLAPVAVVLTFAYFRRADLLRLAPLAMALIIGVQLLAPGAVRMTTGQFGGDQLGAATVSDRTADYDAIRPDLWSHLLFGRGWGSYDHNTYRILDSEFLHRGVEMGLVGVLAYLLVGLSVVLVARRTIASRDPERAPLALIGAAAAASFVVVSALFDVLSFPHATYIFLYMAGLLTVVVRRRTPATA